MFPDILSSLTVGRIKSLWSCFVYPLCHVPGSNPWDIEQETIAEAVSYSGTAHIPIRGKWGLPRSTEFSWVLLWTAACPCLPAWELRLWSQNPYTAQCRSNKAHEYQGQHKESVQLGLNQPLANRASCCHKKRQVVSSRAIAGKSFHSPLRGSVSVQPISQLFSLYLLAFSGKNRLLLTYFPS